MMMGVSVTGQVQTYNPKNKTELQLLQDGEEKYKTIIPEIAGIGLVTQDFAFRSVAPGNYTLAVTKDVHTKFTAQNLEIGEDDVDLKTHPVYSPAVGLITLACGDINGDGMINDLDLTEMWKIVNYNKRGRDPGVNSRCDLNGDGMVNDTDLAILWLAVNYNKGPVVIP
jgi:hypothetical protein